jgi:hypothetical protein
MHKALVLGQELEIGNYSFFDHPREPVVQDLFVYKQACMGGTFDHMHLGHKLLLTQAALLTTDVLHIGITGD